MAQAVGKVQDNVMSGVLCPDDVSPTDIEQHLYTEVRTAQSMRTVIQVFARKAVKFL
jgi:hypothetical protein